jgi:phosphate transport system substrate-binding protein
MIQAFKTFNRQIDKYIDTQLLMTSLIAVAILMLSFKALADSVPVIKIDGSSTVFPITEAVAEEFQKDQKGKVRVTVGISGTGGGFKKFCRGETDVQDASRPISTTEMADCKTAGIKYFELPVAYDAMVIAVNPQNTWVSEITVEELKKMWEPEAQGKVTKWNQVNSKWPDAPLKLFGAGSDSGTFDYFTEAVVGKAKSSRGDYTASEDDNTLVQGISTDKNAIGYVPLSYYEENKTKLKALAVVNPKTKKAEMPSEASVNQGKYIPFSRPLFIYVSETSYKKTEVMNFTKFYLSQSPKLVASAKMISLPSKAYEMGLNILNKSKVGTIFSGHSEVGMKIEEMLKKEGKL